MKKHYKKKLHIFSNYHSIILFLSESNVSAIYIIKSYFRLYGVLAGLHYVAPLIYYRGFLLSVLCKKNMKNNIIGYIRSIYVCFISIKVAFCYVVLFSSNSGWYWFHVLFWTISYVFYYSPVLGFLLTHSCFDKALGANVFYDNS